MGSMEEIQMAFKTSSQQREPRHSGNSILLWRLNDRKDIVTPLTFLCVPCFAGRLRIGIVTVNLNFECMCFKTFMPLRNFYLSVLCGFLSIPWNFRGCFWRIWEAFTISLPKLLLFTSQDVKEYFPERRSDSAVWLGTPHYLLPQTPVRSQTAAISALASLVKISD